MSKKRIQAPETTDQSLPESVIIPEETENSPEDNQGSTSTASSKTASSRKAPARSQKYLSVKKLIDREKLYSPEEAIGLVLKTFYAKFTGSVELHLVTKDAQRASVSFPYSTGKDQKIALVTPEILDQIKKDQIDFDLLIASPSDMAKLAPLAKVLGPKGLMPNPKNGTISNNPEEAKKKLGGKTQFKTEKKAPLIHLVIGKTNQPETELTANLLAATKAVGPQNIQRAVVNATMGPGIKLNPSEL